MRRGIELSSVPAFGALSLQSGGSSDAARDAGSMGTTPPTIADVNSDEIDAMIDEFTKEIEAGSGRRHA